jgi:hypothetical protein
MKQKKIITIEVCRGCVTEVRNLPEGWRYRIDDKDSGCVEVME